MNKSFDDALRRVRAEFVEMPGLLLTRSQVGRLCALDSAIVQSVLETLVGMRFLYETRSGRYGRAGGSEFVPRHTSRVLPGEPDRISNVSA